MIYEIILKDGTKQKKNCDMIRLTYGIFGKKRTEEPCINFDDEDLTTTNKVSEIEFMRIEK